MRYISLDDVLTVQPDKTGFLTLVRMGLRERGWTETKVLIAGKYESRWQHRDSTSLHDIGNAWFREVLAEARRGNDA